MKKILLFILLLIVGCSKPINYKTLIDKDGLMYHLDTKEPYRNNLIVEGGLLYAPNDDKPYTGKVFDFHKNGQKKLYGKYRNGLKNGKWIWWNIDGGTDSTGSYKNGLINGKWTYYTDVGNGKYELTYKAGIYTMAVFTDNLGTNYKALLIKDEKELPITDETLQDVTFLFNEEDKYNFSKFPKVFGTVKDGKKDGLFVGWYKNGQKEAEGTFKDGKQEGLWTVWYENGQKNREGKGKNGKRDGLQTQWYENGQKEYERTFKDGEVIDSICWDRDRNECECHKYSWRGCK